MWKLESNSSTWTLGGTQAFENILNFNTALMISSCIPNWNIICCLNNADTDHLIP